jgi:hypothetical protein
MILGPHQSILGLINEDPHQSSRPKSSIKPELACCGACPACISFFLDCDSILHEGSCSSAPNGIVFLPTTYSGRLPDCPDIPYTTCVPACAFDLALPCSTHVMPRDPVTVITESLGTLFGGKSSHVTLNSLVPTSSSFALSC